MKQVVKSLVIVGAMVAAGSAGADMMWGDFNPVLGIDYQEIWMKGKGFPGKALFPKTYAGATIYVGNKFTENLGLELGYDWSARPKKNWTTAAAFGGVSGTTKIRLQGVHLDLIGYLPMDNCINLFGSIGYGYVKPKVNLTTTTVPATALAATQASALTSITGKGNSVLRVGIGADWMATDMFGFKLKFGWQTTNTLKIKGNQNFTNLGYKTKAFGDSLTAAIGAFVKF